MTLNPKHAQKAAGTTGDAPAAPPEASTSAQAFVLHRQQALRHEAGSMLDKSSGKRARAQKVKKVDELGREENLSLESKTILQRLAKTFLESCFNRA